MKKLKQLTATVLLAMAFVVSVHAGDMQMPPLPPPPPDANGAPITEDQGNQDVTSPCAILDESTIAYDLLSNLLSIF